MKLANQHMYNSKIAKNPTNMKRDQGWVKGGGRQGIIQVLTVMLTLTKQLISLLSS